MPDKSGDWQEFSRPRDVLRASSHDEVAGVLMRAEAAAKQGYYVAGYVSYEAASAFDPALDHHAPGGLPLAAFGVFDKPRVIHLLPGNASLALQPSLSRQKYETALHRIHDYLAKGDTYQVNFTQQLKGTLRGNPDELMAQLFQAQPTPYAMLLEIDEHVICSVSPELFFERHGSELRTEPMKGTRPRGRFPAEDEARRQSLMHSEKDRAENLMILDMIRNDLGRIARAGSVRVDDMFQLKALPTVWQQVSSVSAESNSDISEIFSALFPCASVTGAPKARTMSIIRELELESRGVYTGAVGVIRPGGDCCFSVAIRTLQIDKASAKATYGVGGGIVWDSDIEEEWQEALTKSAILTTTRPDFELLETMRYEPGVGVVRLDYHLSRLASSAVYFGYRCPLEQIRRELEAINEAKPRRIRLVLNQYGETALQILEVPLSSGMVRLRLAPSPVSSEDVFLFHKTTNRDTYERARASVSDCDDVLLFNENGELTETSIANLFLQLGGDLKTPAVSCGLLAGTFRQEMLDSGQAVEAVLTREDLAQADRIFVANSLRGLREAELLED